MRMPVPLVCLPLLCGCASTLHDLPPAASAPLDPALARIEIHRKGAITGAATRDYLLDLGENGERNGTMLQFPKLLKKPFGVHQDAETLETLLQVHRASGRGDGVTIHYLVGAHDLRIDRGVSFDSGKVRLGSPLKDSKETNLRREALPFNVSVVGKVGPTGWLVWDRPPGKVELEIVSRQGGGLLIHPSGGDFFVNAGKTYRITYGTSLKFEVTEVP